jgi:hypothetical protein
MAADTRLRQVRACVVIATADLVGLMTSQYPVAAKALALSPRPWSPFEGRFYRALRAVLEAEALKLAGDITQHGASYVEQESYWAQQRGPLIDAITGSLESIAELGARAGREALGDVAIHVNWSLVNANAGDWARQYSAQLVREIEPTTREAVRQAVADWTASGEGVADLAERIRSLSEAGTSGAFSPYRARLIAQTESTNAFAAGNAQAWTAAGVAPVAFTPAAHPHCRCRLQPVRLPDGSWGVKWMTAEDERVCDEPIRVPWAADLVGGCQYLDGRVVSHGRWLGQMP